MAQRRMFSLKVVDTDNFLEMPVSAQNLYFHLGMRADDDGMVSNPKKIIKICNSADDDMKVLIAKGFVIPMATNGVCVITHWHMNNLIKSDRYTPTIYQEERNHLIEYKGVYSVGFQTGSTDGTQPVPVAEPQDRIGKVRKGKDRGGFIPPTDEEAYAYAKENNLIIDVGFFLKFFRDSKWIDSKGNEVRNWKQKMLTWNKKEIERRSKEQSEDEWYLKYAKPAKANSN